MLPLLAMLAAYGRAAYYPTIRPTLSGALDCRIESASVSKASQWAVTHAAPNLGGRFPAHSDRTKPIVAKRSRLLDRSRRACGHGAESILLEVAMDAWLLWLTLLPMMFWNFVWLVAAIVCGLWTYDRIRGR